MYPYSEPGYNEGRGAYDYSPYHGAAFLDAWKASRMALSADAPVAAPAAKPVTMPLPGNKVMTADLLEAVYAALTKNAGDRPAVRYWLAQLVKKYEVVKRVHGGYDETFRALDKGDCRDVELYVRLAEVFDAAYKSYGTLNYLNALLKLMDGLCGRKAALTKAQAGRVSTLADLEYAHIQALAARWTPPS